jgi:hypothetical protein
MGWSPFAGGGWFNDPIYGWAFIGSQPWGWLPYHYGGWVFDPFFGWLWSPGLGFGYGYGGYIPFRPVTGVFVKSKNGLLGLVPTHPLDVKGKEPINLAKGIFPVAGGAVSQQAMASAGAESWKAMKAPPRESLTGTAVAASSAPMRVSRTIVGGGSSARVVTLDRNSTITYDAREHRFVNGAAAAQSADAKSSATSGASTGERATQGRAEVATAPGARVPANANVRVPTTSARAVTPPTRAMAPPPRPSSAGSGGGCSQGASSRGSGGGSAPSHASASSGGASHPSASSGSGRPH